MSKQSPATEGSADRPEAVTVGETDATILRAAGAGETLDLLARLDRFAATAGSNDTATGGDGSSPPRLLGEYELRDLLGCGGMGAVYRGRHRTLGHEVAIKLLRGDDARDADERAARFYQEARAAAALRHPNLVAVHQVGRDGADHYLVMDLVCGPTLAAVIAEGPLSWQSAAELMRAVADGIALLHDRGIVHRDLKPSNILIDGDGQPRVVDFGLAKLLEGADLRTHSGTLVGTPRYMSPELASGRSREIGPASDLFSLGATLYEMLTGTPAFGGQHPLESLRRVVESEPPPPRQLNRAIPGGLQRIVLKCLAKNPAARYATARALADDLRAVLAGEPPPTATLQPTVALRRQFRRSPALWVRALGLFGVMAAVQVNASLATRVPRQHGLVMSLLVVWLAASAGLHLLQRRQRSLSSTAALPLLWSAVDVGLLTVLLLVATSHHAEGADPIGPLYVGYAVLIAASGFWLERAAVWLTTGLACLGYVGLAAYTAAAEQPLHYPVLVVACLVLVGLATAQQVFRVRWIALADRGDVSVDV